MALVVNSNIASITAQRNLGISTRELQGSVARLSSGLRITQASDDAAGLGISETLRAQIRSINQAVRNSNDGISLLQIADGGAGNIGGILARLRELPNNPPVASWAQTNDHSWIKNSWLFAQKLIVSLQ